MKKNKKYKLSFMSANTVLLALLMIVPGLLKLFSVKATTGMLVNLGFPITGFFVWVLILAELGSGVAILAKWKLEVTKYIPVIILLVAIFTAHWGNMMDILIRLVLISNYLLLKQK